MESEEARLAASGGGGGGGPFFPRLRRAAGRCRRLVFYCRWRRAQACGGVCRCASQLARETPSPLRRRGSVVCAWPSLSRHLSPARARAALSRAPVALANRLVALHSSSGSERRPANVPNFSHRVQTSNRQTCGAGEMFRAPTKFTWLDLEARVAGRNFVWNSSSLVAAGRLEKFRAPGTTKTKICKVTMVTSAPCMFVDLLLLKRHADTEIERQTLW